MYEEGRFILICLKKEDLWTASGQPRTSSLFAETCRQGDTPILSLRGNVDLPCLRDYYVPMVARDPSEQNFVDVVFDGDMKYWFRLRAADWMQDFLKEWREMADIKRKEIAFKAIFKEIEENGKSAFTAAKYLIEEPWKGQTKEVKKTRKETSERAFNPFKEDFERLKDEGLVN